MFFSLITIFCAFLVSAIAAYYSVVGLIALFAAAPIPIALMGGSLELAKLVTASWLYRNWKTAPKLLKYYFTFAVMILMFITSLGIFGFLSRAHIEANVGLGENSSKISILEQREKIVKERLDYLLLRAGDDPTKISRRTDQAIQQTQQELIDLQNEKLPLVLEQNTLMAEVGPLKYIAEMIHGDNAEQSFDSAVRFVIILLIFVFDPLAVLLIVAANHSLRQQDQNLSSKKEKINFEAIDPIPMNKQELEETITFYSEKKE